MTLTAWDKGFGGKSPETTKYLYKLEEIGIIVLRTIKDKKTNMTKYLWELTKKGEEILKSDKDLKNLWKSSNLKELYEKIKDLKIYDIE